ncbi:MAG: hypothetical protein AAF542_14330 [Pseudomonadota bacterium]
MTTNVSCWHCGNPLQNLILPLSRREECSSCAADQHVCKMCGYFDANTVVQCSEERAEPPGDKEAANFCDYFLLSSSSAGESAEQYKATQQLNELFGDNSLDAPSWLDADDSSSGGSKQSTEFDPEAELKKLFDN